MKIFFISIFFIFGASLADYSPRELRCLVCEATIKEMINDIEKTNPNKKIQVGGYRVDESGNLQEKLVPFARSGMHLSELMDNVCQSMEEYVRATDKTGKLVLVRLVNSDGTMNPEVSNVNVVQDNDLNKSLNFYCEGIVEEFEDEIYDELKEPSPDPINAICSKRAGLCESDDKDEL